MTINDYIFQLSTLNTAKRMGQPAPHKAVMLLSVRAKNLLVEEYPLAAKDLSCQGRTWCLDTDVFAMEGKASGTGHIDGVGDGEYFCGGCFNPLNAYSIEFSRVL